MGFVHKVFEGGHYIYLDSKHCRRYYLRAETTWGRKYGTMLSFRLLDELPFIILFDFHSEPAYHPKVLKENWNIFVTFFVECGKFIMVKFTTSFSI